MGTREILLTKKEYVRKFKSEVSLHETIPPFNKGIFRMVRNKAAENQYSFVLLKNAKRDAGMGGNVPVASEVGMICRK